MKRLNHPNIAQIFGSFAGDKAIGFVQPYYGLSPSEYIESHSPTQEQRRDLFKQLVLGLGYLHQQGIIHRDVKADNILISDGGVLTLIDFDCATVDPSAETITWFGTEGFEAPEATAAIDIFGAVYDDGVDWFGAGMVLCDLVIEGGCSLKAKWTQIPVIDDLISRLCDDNPRTRWSYANGNFQDILDHRYFSLPIIAAETSEES